MPQRTSSRWISFKNAPLYAINLAGYESDRPGILAEIEAAEAVICKQEKNSLLTVLDLAQTEMIPEIVAFIHAHGGGPSDPIRKLAIVGVTGWQKIWYRLKLKITWPKHARFFYEHEKAKAWLILETI